MAHPVSWQVSRTRDGWLRQNVERRGGKVLDTGTQPMSHPPDKPPLGKPSELDFEQQSWKRRAKQPDYTNKDALHDHANNLKALQAGAGRIADGAATKISNRYPDWHPGADWFAAARQVGVERAQDWRPETRHPFPKFICKCVDNWYERQRSAHAKQKAEGGTNPDAPIDDHTPEDYVEIDESIEALLERAAVHSKDGAGGETEAGAVIAQDPRLDRLHVDGERLNPKDDGERGNIIERQRKPLTARYRTPIYNPMMESELLADFARDHKEAHRHVTAIEPYTTVKLETYVNNSRPKARWTDADRDKFSEQIRNEQILLLTYGRMHVKATGKAAQQWRRKVDRESRVSAAEARARYALSPEGGADRAAQLQAEEAETAKRLRIEQLERDAVKRSKSRKRASSA